MPAKKRPSGRDPLAGETFIDINAPLPLPARGPRPPGQPPRPQAAPRSPRGIRAASPAGAPPEGP